MLTNCRIRHKKCDERVPSCSPCKSTGRKCDFELLTVEIPLETNLKSNQLSLAPLNNAIDQAHFDYFVNVCTREFSLYFESPAWENIVLQAACTESCIRHSALALGAMSRHNYRHHLQLPQSSDLLLEYSMMQYNMALRALNDTLDGSMRSLELAILGSIVFIAFEVLWGADTRVKVHMDGAFSILNSLTGADVWYTRTYSQCLVSALKRLSEQISSFGGYLATIRAGNEMG
ncbi:hypothetical protein DPV78_002683 [Talaromyces pinophilus]|nr:hypothetical protein DPV78_002683 [Talaromyces pinophilus]